VKQWESHCSQSVREDLHVHNDQQHQVFCVYRYVELFLLLLCLSWVCSVGTDDVGNFFSLLLFCEINGIGSSCLVTSSFFLSLSVSLFVCLTDCLSVCLSVSHSLSLTISLSLTHSLTLSHSLSLSLFVCLTVCLSLTHSLSPALSFSQLRSRSLQMCTINYFVLFVCAGGHLLFGSCAVTRDECGA
jgi:hypothetical protein